MNTNALSVLNKALKLSEDSGEISKTERLIDLIKAHDDEHTTGWFMCVPSCFNAALDIRQTERKRDKKKILVWTQGSTFSFKKGDKIYDTSDAYSEWGKALKKLSLIVNIEEAADATPKKGSDEKENLVPRNPGYVRFSLYKPHGVKPILVKYDEDIMTQDEFVRFLIKGPEGEHKKRILGK